MTKRSHAVDFDGSHGARVFTSLGVTAWKVDQRAGVGFFGGEDGTCEACRSPERKTNAVWDDELLEKASAQAGGSPRPGEGRSERNRAFLHSHVVAAQGRIADRRPRASQDRRAAKACTSFQGLFRWRKITAAEKLSGVLGDVGGTKRVSYRTPRRRSTRVMFL
jgi:hypothetical protein